MTIYAAEGGHFYKRDGTPAYTVIAKGSGLERPTTLRDARLHDLVPSVTGILAMAAKPGLENWKIDQGILAALTLPRHPQEHEQDWLKRVKEDAKEQAKQAAEAGTRMHAALQSFYQGGPTDEVLWPVVSATAAAIEDEFDEQKWESELSFAHPLGYGGKTDLVGRMEPVVIDFKGRDFGPDDKIVPYDENVIQLAAYREGLGLSNATCANLFFSRTVPGLVHLHVWTELEVARGWRMFTSLLEFWKAKNRYLND